PAPQGSGEPRDRSRRDSPEHRGHEDREGAAPQDDGRDARHRRGGESVAHLERGLWSDMGGMCRGGPYDGQWHKYHASRMPVLSQSSRDIGEYLYTMNGQWIWSPLVKEN